MRQARISAARSRRFSTSAGSFSATIRNCGTITSARRIPTRPTKARAPEAYAIQCVVIAGKSPREPNTKKSFELYRNGLAGVLVLTFDELLLKLETLLELLRNPDATKLVVPTRDHQKTQAAKETWPGRRRR